MSRLEKAGFTLSSAIPLLKLADDVDLLGVLDASSDNLLPIVGAAIEASPKLIPLAATALNIPPSTYFAAAAALLLVAAGILAVIPDDSVGTVALQTALVIPLGLLLPGALGATGVILSKLKI